MCKNDKINVPFFFKILLVSRTAFSTFGKSWNTVKDDMKSNFSFSKGISKIDAQILFFSLFEFNFNNSSDKSSENNSTFLSIKSFNTPSPEPKSNKFPEFGK